MKRLYVCRAEPWIYDLAPSAPATKIGVSANPFRRKWGLRRKGCDNPRLIWQSEPTEHAFMIEAFAKRRLAKRCVAGTEWFDVKPETAIRLLRTAISEAEAAKRARIPGRTMRRRFGPRGTPSFGRVEK